MKGHQNNFKGQRNSPCRHSSLQFEQDGYPYFPKGMGVDSVLQVCQLPLSSSFMYAFCKR